MFKLPSSMRWKRRNDIEKHLTYTSRYQTLSRKDSYNAVAGGNDNLKKHRCEADRSQFMWNSLCRQLAGQNQVHNNGGIRSNVSK